MSDLRFVAVPSDEDDAVLLDWMHVHNVIIPADPLTAQQIAERALRNRLTVAYHGDVLVGCSTVRLAGGGQAVTVIARVLPGHRRQGYGEQIYQHALGIAGDGEAIETVVLASNVDGLRFAQRHGFVEVDRYLLDGQSVPFVDLRLG